MILLATCCRLHSLLLKQRSMSAETKLSHPKMPKAELFEPGQVDEFVVTCPYLGDLIEIRLWHDNDG